MKKEQKFKSLDRVRRMHRGFNIQMWIARGASGKSGRDTYNYKVTTPTGVVFIGKGYQPTYSLYGNGEAIIDGLLMILCVRPGDKNVNWFSKYTPEQLAWANSPECAQVQSELMEIEKTI